MGASSSSGAVRRIAVFADVNMNLIDGSTIWLQSVALALSKIPGAEVHVILRDPVERTLLLEPLIEREAIHIVAPTPEPDDDAPRMTPDDLLEALNQLDEAAPLSAVLVRGGDFATRIADAEGMAGRLWAYVLDRPPLIGDVEEAGYARLAENALFVILQSEPQRALFEARVPGAAGKCIVLPPILPMEAAPPSAPRAAPSGQIKLAYAGKYSALWNVEAYFDLPGLAKEAGLDAKLLCIGDKVHNEPEDANFFARVHEKLRTTSNVEWRQGLSRQETLGAINDADFGLCWRKSDLDNSVEISTKFLEFASLGVPVFVNRSENYELSLGEDYPFFVSSQDEIIEALKTVAAAPETYADASRRCLELAQRFTMEAAVARLSRLTDLTAPSPDAGASAARVLIAGHDFKFLSAVLSHFRQRPDVHVKQDVWRGMRGHDPNASRKARDWAETIFCEWCAGAAVWYSNNKKPGQRLIIRLHRNEYFTPFPAQVNIAAVDAVIVVSDWFKSRLILDHGWPAAKIHVLAQYVDAPSLDRAKHAASEKTIGLVGIVPFHHKRVDRAIDVLEALRRTDDDFRLRIRSRMPWEFDWAWRRDPDAREKYQKVFSRILTDPALKEAVIFDRAGPDMAEWYRNVGYMLSTSESEGCHTSIAEGMAGGAIPAIINWDGASSVYPDAFVHEDTDAMAHSIAQYAADADRRAATTIQMKEIAARDFDITRTLRLFDTLVLGEEPQHAG